MPRVRINVQHIDEIDQLEEQEDWESRLGYITNGQRHEVRDSVEVRVLGRRTQRFDGAETIDRKRTERRKQINRGKRR